VSDFYKKPRVTCTEGWALSASLIENPYQSFHPDEARVLCAEFRRMVFEDGVPVRPSIAHVPGMIALTEEELRDTSSDSWASVMNVPGTLRQAAFEKFPPLSHPEPVPTHVVEPVEAAQVFVIYKQPQRQKLVPPPPPAERPSPQLHMKG
jgi:hypothetical protein